MVSSINGLRFCLSQTLSHLLNSSCFILDQNLEVFVYQNIRSCCTSTKCFLEDLFKYHFKYNIVHEILYMKCCLHGKQSSFLFNNALPDHPPVSPFLNPQSLLISCSSDLNIVHEILYMKCCLHGKQSSFLFNNALPDHPPVSPFLNPQSLLISCSSTELYPSLHYVIGIMTYHKNSAPFLYLLHHYCQSQYIIFIRLLCPSLPAFHSKLKCHLFKNSNPN